MIRYWFTLILLLIIGFILAIDVALWSDNPIFPWYISIIGISLVCFVYAEISFSILYTLIYSGSD